MKCSLFSVFSVVVRPLKIPHAVKCVGFDTNNSLTHKNNQLILNCNSSSLHDCIVPFRNFHPCIDSRKKPSSKYFTYVHGSFGKPEIKNSFTGDYVFQVYYANNWLGAME